ncbi:MAG: rhodanese-like domain-containing protein [Bacilli bacterium]|nr:rhodanese-like domain-containing protein [Bacilli bacterium]
MKKVLVIVCLLFLCGCGNTKNTDGLISEVITSEQLNSIIEENNYIILDVRTEAEFNESHIEGAVNIPYTTIDENIELDKSKDILVYCKSGGRSQMATQTLNSLGYTVYDMGAIDNIDLPKN